MAGLACLAVLATASAAGAHEVLHAVERDHAIAVKVYVDDGEVLAYASYEVYSPVDPKIPYQEGRTDRGGYLAFVPDVVGTWRVKVVDDTGHGLDTGIDVGAVAARADGNASAPGSAGFILRPLVGIAIIGAVFAALLTFLRRGNRTP